IFSVLPRRNPEMSENAKTLAEEAKRLADEMTDKACGDFLQASIAAERQALHTAIDRLASRVEALEANKERLLATLIDCRLSLEVAGFSGELAVVDAAIAQANASRAEGGK